MDLYLCIEESAEKSIVKILRNHRNDLIIAVPLREVKESCEYESEIREKEKGRDEKGIISNKEREITLDFFYKILGFQIASWKPIFFCINSKSGTSVREFYILKMTLVSASALTNVAYLSFIICNVSSYVHRSC